MKLLELIFTAIRIWLKNFWKLTLINIPGAFAIWVIIYLISVNILKILDISQIENTTIPEIINLAIDNFSFFNAIDFLGLVLAFTLLSFPVGATLVAASNAAIRRPVRIWESFRKTFGFKTFLKNFANSLVVSTLMLVSAFIGRLITLPVWII